MDPRMTWWYGNINTDYQMLGNGITVDGVLLPLKEVSLSASLNWMNCMTGSSVLTGVCCCCFPSQLIFWKSSSARTAMTALDVVGIMVQPYWPSSNHSSVTLPTAPLLTLGCTKDRSPVCTSASCVMDWDGALRGPLKRTSFIIGHH